MPRGKLFSSRSNSRSRPPRLPRPRPPAALAVQGHRWRSFDTNDASRHSVGGGGERNRTDDLLLAKQALSQLSYTPQGFGRRSRPKSGSGGSGALALRELHVAAGAASRRRSSSLHRAALAVQAHRWRGLIRTTPCVVRSVVGQGGFEPPTSRLSSARSNQLSY